MRCTFAFFTMMVVASLIGCTQGTPGGPGTTGEQPTFGQAENTFNLSGPRSSTSLQQGETTEATIGIKRATNFDEDVMLILENVPQGVTVEPSSPAIKSSDTDVRLTLSASDEAPVGDYVVTITGKPTSGGDAHIEFNLTITPKDSFTLSMPSSQTIAQGESQEIVIKVNRDSTFDQDVTLEIGDLPSGVTAEPKSVTFKRGEVSSQVMLTAAEDASLGDFTIPVTGRPTDGVEASKELSLTVTEKKNP